MPLDKNELRKLDAIYSDMNKRLYNNLRDMQSSIDAETKPEPKPEVIRYFQGPWYRGKVYEQEYGGPLVSVGPFKADYHWESTIAEIYCLNKEGLIDGTASLIAAAPALYETMQVIERTALSESVRKMARSALDQVLRGAPYDED